MVCQNAYVVLIWYEKFKKESKNFVFHFWNTKLFKSLCKIEKTSWACSGSYGFATKPCTPWTLIHLETHLYSNSIDSLHTYIRVHTDHDHVIEYSKAARQQGSQAACKHVSKQGMSLSLYLGILLSWSHKNDESSLIVTPCYLSRILNQTSEGTLVKSPALTGKWTGCCTPYNLHYIREEKWVS